MIEHLKAYGIYYWNSADGRTTLIAEEDNVADMHTFLDKKVLHRISAEGKDIIHVEDRMGKIIQKFIVN